MAWRKEWRQKLFGRGQQSQKNTTERWRRITNLIDGALQRPDPGERADYLLRSCDGDRELYREVERLLRFESVDSGSLAEAEEIYRRLLDFRRHHLMQNPIEIASSLRSLGNVLFLRGKFEKAETRLRESLELRQQHLGVDSVRTAAVWSSLGRLLHAQGSLAEAARALTTALEIRVRRLGDDHLHVALTRKDLANLYFDLDEDVLAERLWGHAMTVLRAEKEAGSWELADAESQLGGRLMAAGRLDEAEVLLKQSYSLLREVRGEEAIYTRQAKARLEELYLTLNTERRHRCRSTSSTTSKSMSMM